MWKLPKGGLWSGKWPEESEGEDGMVEWRVIENDCIFARRPPAPARVMGPSFVSLSQLASEFRARIRPRPRASVRPPATVPVPPHASIYVGPKTLPGQDAHARGKEGRNVGRSTEGFFSFLLSQLHGRGRESV